MASSRVGITTRTLIPVLTALVLLLAVVMALGIVGMEQALHERAEQEVSRHAAHFHMELEELAEAAVPHRFQDWVESVSHDGLSVELYSMDGELLAGPRERVGVRLDQREGICSGCHLPGARPGRQPLVWTSHEGELEVAGHAELIFPSASCTGCHQGALGLLVVKDDTEDEEAAVRRIALYWGVGGGLALVVLGLLTAWALRVQVLGPILRLQRRVARVRRGELRTPTQPDYAPHEVGDLSRGFDEMVVELGDAHGRLEDLLQQRTLQVEELALHLRQLQVQLLQMERLSTIGELSAMLAHEVRNPLNALGLNVQLAERAARKLDDPDGVMDRLDTARAEITRLNEVLQRFLDLGRGSPRRRIVFDLGSVCTGVVELVRPAVERASCTLELDGSDLELPVYGDEGACWQIVINLVNNASQAPGATRVLVRGRADGEVVVVDVVDDGHGIPEAQQASVFEPFYTTREGGSGLGLPISRRLAREHGGELEYRDTPGGGATFRLTLPLAGEQP